MFVSTVSGPICPASCPVLCHFEGLLQGSYGTRQLCLLQWLAIQKPSPLPGCPVTRDWHLSVSTIGIGSEDSTLRLMTFRVNHGLS